LEFDGRFAFPQRVEPSPEMLHTPIKIPPTSVCQRFCARDASETLHSNGHRSLRMHVRALRELP
jgi:hypothetical protein